MKFGLWIDVDEWYMTVFHMTRSKVNVMEVWKLWKWPISESYLFCQYSCNQKS